MSNCTFSTMGRVKPESDWSMSTAGTKALLIYHFLLGLFSAINWILPTKRNNKNIILLEMSLELYLITGYKFGNIMC